MNFLDRLITFKTHTVEVPFRGYVLHPPENDYTMYQEWCWNNLEPGSWRWLRNEIEFYGAPMPLIPKDIKFYKLEDAVAFKLKFGI